MGEARRPTVGEWVELKTLQDDHSLAWRPARVVQTFDEFLVFQTEEGRRPAYGYSDEGRVWRYPPAVALVAAVRAFVDDVERNGDRDVADSHAYKQLLASLAAAEKR